MADRFVFEYIRLKSANAPHSKAAAVCGKRVRPSADDGAPAKKKTANKERLDKIAQQELEALRSALASAKVLLKAKEVKETENRRQVYCHHAWRTHQHVSAHTSHAIVRALDISPSRRLLQEEEQKRALHEQMEQLKQELLSAEKAKEQLDEHNVLHTQHMHAHASVVALAIHACLYLPSALPSRPENAARSGKVKSRARGTHGLSRHNRVHMGAHHRHCVS